jgi:hypothetical protein
VSESEDGGADDEGSAEAAHEWDLWWDRGPVWSSLVADLEREAGRKAQPFQLQVTEIPVAGRELWQLDPHHVLVTAELVRDSDEYRRLMTPVVRALP